MSKRTGPTTFRRSLFLDRRLVLSVGISFIKYFSVGITLSPFPIILFWLSFCLSFPASVDPLPLPDLIQNELCMYFYTHIRTTLHNIIYYKFDSSQPLHSYFFLSGNLIELQRDECIATSLSSKVYPFSIWNIPAGGDEGINYVKVYQII